MSAQQVDEQLIKLFGNGKQIMWKNYIGKRGTLTTLEQNHIICPIASFHPCIINLISYVK